MKQIPQDRIIDVSPPLLARKKKESVSGSIHLRVYHSCARETRSLQQVDMASVQFLYRPYKNLFKPGDLIGYSGYGVISGLQKILTGNPITRYLSLALPHPLVYSNFSIGMVLYLPNKWTSDVEPFVVEMTRYCINVINCSI